jgi:hypothetical protein
VADPGQWGTWLEAREPVSAAMALLRVVALAAAWYLLVTSVVGAALRLVRARRLVSMADRLTVPALRRLLVATAGMTLASGMLPSAAILAGSSHPAAVATSVPHPLVTTAAPTTTTTVATAPPTVTMRLLPPEPAAVPVVTPPPAPAARVVTATWTVRAGECFWSIAEEVLLRAWGRPVSDAEIVPYWRMLIEENRHRLGDPRNADLIFAGQVFDVPAPPPRAA